MITSGRVAQAMYVAAKLNIADLLADGPKTTTSLDFWPISDEP